jgi:hypothetical protein
MAALKIFLYLFAVSIGFIYAPEARADGTIPPELSALLLSPDFPPIVASLIQQGNPGIQRISVTQYQIFSTAGQTSISLKVDAESLIRLGHSRKLGTVNANITKDKLGTLSAENVIFVATPPTPGGASVGN